MGMWDAFNDRGVAGESVAGSRGYYFRVNLTLTVSQRQTISESNTDGKYGIWRDDSDMPS